MSVSEFPIPSEDEARREAHCDEVGEGTWSPRLTLLVVVLSSLVLWSGIILTVAWLL